MTAHSLGPVIINGERLAEADASVSVFDIGFQRGYGCFEAMRTYGGIPFRLGGHLDRLENSAANLLIDLPSRTDLFDWCMLAAEPGDGVLRVYVTGGTDARHPGTDNVVVVFLEPLPEISETVRLDIIEAPWHADGRSSELTGAKTLSYGPNLAATIAARRRGFDDAVLVGNDDAVLEGPTFSIGWVSDGVVCTPHLASHILASITRQATIEVADRLGITVREEHFRRIDLLGADEVFVMSTVREVLPVTAVGSITIGRGPVVERLQEGFHRLVSEEVG